MRRTLSFLVILASLGLLLPACTPASTPAPTPTEVDLPAEEQAVYTAVFAEIYGEPRMYVLVDLTSPGIGGVEEMDSAIDLLLPQMKTIEAATVDNFLAANDAAYPVPAGMDLGLPYVLLTGAEFNEIFDINTSGWDVFYTRYPNSPGMTTVSRVGFNADATQALVYAGTQSHWLAGAGFYILLEKEAGAWQVIQQVMAWIS